MTATLPQYSDCRVWVDILNIRSLFLSVWSAKRLKVTQIAYLNHTFFAAKILGRSSSFLGIKYKCLDDVAYGEWPEKGVPLYERVENTIRDVLSCASRDWASALSSLPVSEGYDPRFLEQFLRHRGHSYLIRPATLISLIEHMGARGECVLLRKNPFSKNIEKTFKGIEFRWHAEPKLRWRFVPRELHIRDTDTVLQRYYLTGSWVEWSRLMVFSFLGLIYKTLVSKDVDVPVREKPAYGALIGAGFYEPDQLNDLYWASQSEINAADVTAVSHLALREEDVANLHRDGFRLIYVLPFFKWIKNRHLVFGVSESLPSPGGSISFRSFLRSVSVLPKAFFMGHSMTAWVDFWLVVFFLRVSVRKEFFRRQNFRIYFDNNVLNADAAIDAQAMRCVHGIRVSTQNCHYDGCFVSIEPACDLFFTWGVAHQAHPLMQHSKALLGSVSVGHALDYLRGIRKSESRGIRNQNAGSFQIAYIDQGLALDAWANPKRHLDMWCCFIDLLHEYPQLGIIWKPKRNHVTNWLLTGVVEIQNYIDNRRITILETLSHGRKVAPLNAAFAADLVVANGVTTSGFECAFAGLPTICFDPSRASRDFIPAKFREGRIFFEIRPFKRVVEDMVTKRRATEELLFPTECLEFLDHWRDGGAARRSGNVMQQVYEALNNDTPETVARSLDERIQSEVHKAELILGQH